MNSALNKLQWLIYHKTISTQSHLNEEKIDDDDDEEEMT